MIEVYFYSKKDYDWKGRHPRLKAVALGCKYKWDEDRQGWVYYKDGEKPLLTKAVSRETVDVMEASMNPDGVLIDVEPKNEEVEVDKSGGDGEVAFPDYEKIAPNRKRGGRRMIKRG